MGMIFRTLAMVNYLGDADWDSEEIDYGVEECGACDSTSDCMAGYSCCPNQNQCIPSDHLDCLCYDGFSSKVGVNGDNNERVASGADDCGGELCEFCPATAPAEGEEDELQEEEEAITVGYVPECSSHSPGW